MGRKVDHAPSRALSEKLRSLKRPYLHSEHTRWRAAIAAQLGDKDEAVDLLREAFAQGQPYGIWLHRDATLEPLRGYPPFEDLVRPKGGRRDEHSSGSAPDSRSPRTPTNP